MRRRCIPALFLVLVLLVAALASAPLSVSAATKSASKIKNKNSSKNKNGSKNKNSSKSKNKVGKSSTTTTTVVAAAAATNTCKEPQSVCYLGTTLITLSDAFKCGNTQDGSTWKLLPCTGPGEVACRLTPPSPLPSPTTEWEGKCADQTIKVTDLGTGGIKIVSEGGTIGKVLLKGGNGYCSYADYPDGGTSLPTTPKNCGGKNQCGLSHADICYTPCQPSEIVRWVEEDASISVANGETLELCRSSISSTKVWVAYDNCGNTPPVTTTVAGGSLVSAESTIDGFVDISTLDCGQYTITYGTTLPDGDGADKPPDVNFEIVDTVDSAAIEDSPLCATTFKTKCLDLTITPKEYSTKDCVLTAKYETQKNHCQANPVEVPIADKTLTLSDKCVVKPT